MLIKSVVFAAFMLSACSTQVVYVYPDAGTPEGDAAQANPDAHTLLADAPDAVIVHEDAAVGNTCEPDRAPGAISQADCLGNAAHTICDAISETCVAAPHALCGACNSDAQCTGVDLHAQCVFIPGDVATNNDQACLVPCAGDSDCTWITAAYGWGSNARCRALPSGSFCIGDWITPNCRNPDGSRAGDRPWGM